MASKPLDDRLLQEAVDAVAEHGAIVRAADVLGMARGTLEGRLRQATRRNIVANIRPEPPAPIEVDTVDLGGRLMGLLRKSPLSMDDMTRRFESRRGQIIDAIDALRLAGHRVEEQGGKYYVPSQASPAFMVHTDNLPTYTSRPDGTYVFGACGDNHLGSKYARLDVLESLYDIYAAEGVDRVFNTGNWIDGEARFNTHDLLVHGMDAQLRYLAKNYPKRAGIQTYAVAGDDHEGWYAQKMGIDIGRRAEATMREHGRLDWHNLGYMEAHVRLVHAESGASSILAVVHPGGGSSYALSYSIQKIIESLDGGEKPAVGLYGHYHKLWAGNIRNVWCVQTGTTEDQTPFMRKKKLEAHVGGTLIKLTQDPRTGAITRCQPEMMRYFNRGFYNNRWNHGDDVQHAVRSVA